MHDDDENNDDVDGEEDDIDDDKWPVFYLSEAKWTVVMPLAPILLILAFLYLMPW